MSNEITATLPDGTTVKGTPAQIAELLRTLGTKPTPHVPLQPTPAPSALRDLVAQKVPRTSSCEYCKDKGRGLLFPWECPECHKKYGSQLTQPYMPSKYYAPPATQPCRQCSGPVGIVGNWSCSGCGNNYTDTSQIYCTSSMGPR